jgi:hypothetical protein
MIRSLNFFSFFLSCIYYYFNSTTMSEKEAKEYLLDKNVLKEEMQSFIRTQDLKALGEEPLVVNSFECFYIGVNSVLWKE